MSSGFTVKLYPGSLDEVEGKVIRTPGLQPEVVEASQIPKECILLSSMIEMFWNSQLEALAKLSEFEQEEVRDKGICLEIDLPADRSQILGLIGFGADISQYYSAHQLTERDLDLAVYVDYHCYIEVILSCLLRADFGDKWLFRAGQLRCLHLLKDFPIELCYYLLEEKQMATALALSAKGSNSGKCHLAKRLFSQIRKENMINFMGCYPRMYRDNTFEEEQSRRTFERVF